MFISKRLAVSAVAMLLLGACTTPGTLQQSAVPGPALGRVAGADEVKAWSISIPPSGVGLPAGSGSVQQGLAVYTAKCVACHGEKGVGKPADAMAGGKGTLASADALRTVGSYWPYATTLFDYVRRSMPVNAPMSLSNDEVYAVTAYMLNINAIVPAEAVMNAQTLPQVAMPNRAGFVDYSRK
jgi:S-disulfanyl-L-cysteine oxidoreductase SoxD